MEETKRNETKRNGKRMKNSVKYCTFGYVEFIRQKLGKSFVYSIRVIRPKQRGTL